MGRWEPNARERLVGAAIELYAARGYEATPVAAIAERAGLTERTFFRYYADKREVLFDGSEEFQARFVDPVLAADAALSPLDTVLLGVLSVAEFMQPRREFAILRRDIIRATPELLERELIKMARLTGALAAQLRDRGVTEPAASLAAQAGVAVFHVAFDRWLDGDGSQSFAEVVGEARDGLREVATA